MPLNRPQISPSAWKSVFSLTLFCFAVGLAGCATAPPLPPTEQGFAALAAGDWRSAKTHFAEALRADSQNGRAWLGQARAQTVGGDPEAALRSLSSLSKVDGALFQGEGQAAYADGLEGAARQRLKRDQSEAGLAAVRALGRVDPKRSGIGRLLGSALIDEGTRRRFLGDKENALALYREACQVSPGQLEGWVGAAEILLEAKKGREAIQLLEAASKRHPTAGAIRSLSLQAIHDR